MNVALLVVSIFVYFVLFFILILNDKFKNNIIKYLFMLFVGIMIFIVTITNDNIMDYILRFFIRFIFFPDLASILVCVFVSLICFMYSILSGDIDRYCKIVNYIYSFFVFVSYINFIGLDVDSNLYNSIYSGYSLIFIRIISISTIVWVLVYFIRGLVNYFIKKR